MPDTPHPSLVADQGETLLQAAVKRQLERIAEAEKRQRIKHRQAYRQWRAEAVAKA